jgi:hypothetical protein
MSEDHATPSHITIELSREHGRFQLSINGNGLGYRIFGPKFTGHSELVCSVTLTERDAVEIRRYLDQVSDGRLG